MANSTSGSRRQPFRIFPQNSNASNTRLKAIESKAGFWKYIVEPTIETSESAAKASLSLRVWQNNTNQYKKTQTYLFTKEELARYDFQSDEYASPTYI